MKSKKVLGILGSLSVYSGYYKAVKDYLQPMVAVWALSIPLMTEFEEDQRSAVMVGLVFFVVYLFSSLASRKSGYFADRFTGLSAPMNLSLAIGLLFGLFSGFFYSQDLWILAVVLFMAIYMVENIRKPIGVAYLGSSIDKGVLATVLSVDSQLKSLTAAILAPIFGIFADLYGVGWSILFVSLGLILLLPLLRLKPEGNTSNG